jgi:hypothetical protein
VDRAAVHSAVVVARRSRGHRHHARTGAIEVADGGQGGSEAVLVVERPSEPTGGAADLSRAVAGPVAVEEQDLDGAPVEPAVVAGRDADRERRDTAGGAVDVAEVRHRGAELVPVQERIGEAAGEVADLLHREDGPAGIQEQDVDGAAIDAPVVIELGSHGEREDARAGAVEVTQARDGTAEIVADVERRPGEVGDIADLLRAQHGPR